MADFNISTMIDVTRPVLSLQAAFTGSATGYVGGADDGQFLSVTNLKSGVIAKQMLLTPTGYDKLVIYDKRTPLAGEQERWKTLRVYAGIEGSVTNGVLTVTSVWHGSLASLGSSKYLYIAGWASGAQGMSVVSVDANGLGTYSLSLSTTRNVSQRRMLVVWVPQSSQTIPAGTEFVGSWDLGSVSSVSPTTNQSAVISLIGSAASSCGRGVYFPPGRYVGPASLSGVNVYGASSKGTDAQRSVLQQDFSITNPWTVDLNAKSLTDLRLDGLDPGNCKTIKNCYFWMPDNTTTFTGNINGTTLTVETLPASGFIFVGASLTGTGVTTCSIVSCLSGTPGGIGTYQVSVSQTVASGTMTVSRDTSSHYFSSDSLASGADYEITGNVFDLPGVYIAVWILNPKTALISKNIFPDRIGSTSHVIRVDASDGLAESIEVTYNKIDRQCITGIFAGSNRLAPIINLVMDWNEIHKNTEEAIAIDGFGNNVGLCPCICNGRLTSITNDANGRLVVSLNEFIYATGTSTRARMTVAAREQSANGYISGDVFTITTSHNGYTAPKSTIKGDNIPDGTVINEIITRPGIGNANSVFRLNKSLNLGSANSNITVKLADWKKFKFIFSEGTGSDGSIIDIYDYDTANNTITLDIFRSASLFNTGANTWAGIHAGFFGGSCSHNKVTGDAKAGQNSSAAYSTGISLYHNVFGFDVGHNVVTGINDGIRVVGGYMLSTYHVLAYNNSLHNNVVSNSQTGKDGVAVVTQYSGIPQRGNKITNNSCINGNITLTSAEDTVCENNVLAGNNANIIRTFPTPIIPATNI